MEQNQGSQETGMKNFREEMAEVLDRFFKDETTTTKRFEKTN